MGEIQEGIYSLSLVNYKFIFLESKLKEAILESNLLRFQRTGILNEVDYCRVNGLINTRFKGQDFEAMERNSTFEKEGRERISITISMTWPGPAAES